MDRPKHGVAVKVFGDYACFSRPELKVERVSYDVITPSAARGVLEAIFWKPEFRYEVREIHVLKLGAKVSILRNELATRQAKEPILIGGQRAQRTSLILCDVAYAIRAELNMRNGAEAGGYLEQFNRRIEAGQCHHTPYLGTREFAAAFEAASVDECGERQNPELTLHIGTMLFDQAYIEKQGEKNQFWKGTGQSRRLVNGTTVPLMFDAWIRRGVVTVPREKYGELYALENGHA